MTINNGIRTAGPFIGNGTVSTFSFAFKVFQASDLFVARQTTSTGAQTTLALTTDYTVSLNVDQDNTPGGTITLVAGALAIGYTLVITSSIVNLQPTSLTNQGGFYPEVINDSLDRATIQIQQVASSVSRSLVAPVSDGDAINLSLPSAVNRANKYLSFDSSGRPVAALGTDVPYITSPGNLTLTANNGGTNVSRDVIFYDNTTETMRILGSGATSKVGIGIGNPTTKLHVSGSSATNESIYLANSSSTSFVQMFAAGSTGVPTAGVPANSVWIEGAPASTGNTYLSSYNNNLAFATGSGRTERMRIDTNGRVGIGTGSPQAPLHVNGQIAFGTIGAYSIIGYDGANNAVYNAYSGHVWQNGGTEKMRIEAASGRVGIGTASPASILDISGGDLRVRNSGSVYVDPINDCALIHYSSGGLMTMSSSGSGSSAISFRTSLAGSNQEQIRIDSSGNVGIGTSTPGVKLDVNVAATGSSSISDGISVKNTTNNSYGSIHPQGTTSPVPSWNNGVVFEGVPASTGNTIVSTYQNALVFQTNNRNERMRIESDGKVGIGTASPGALFHANGTIRYTNRPAAGTITAIGYDTNGDLKNSSSSLRYKNAIESYSRGLDTIANLRPVSFKFNGEDRLNAGFIAEEIDALGLHELMLYDEQGRPDGVLYANMVAMLTKGIQELKSIVESQAARIAALEARA